MPEPVDLDALEASQTVFNSAHHKESWFALIAALRATRAERDAAADGNAWWMARRQQARAERAEAERDAARRAADDREQARLLQELRAEEFKAAIARVEVEAAEVGLCCAECAAASRLILRALRGDQ